MRNGKKIFLIALFCVCFVIFACEKKDDINKNAIIIRENDTELLFGKYYRETDALSNVYNPTQEYKSTLNKEAVKWIILEKDEKKKEMLLITKFAIDKLDIGDGGDKKELTWENSNIREYLNGKLFDEMFDENDKLSLVKTIIKDESKNNIDSKIKTEDYMFLLSDEEVKKYNLGIVSATNYASNNGSIQHNSCSWWLRTSAIHNDKLCFVDFKGEINYEGAREDERIFLRPAIKVKFDYDINNEEKKELIEKSKKNDIIDGGVSVGLVGYEIEFGEYRFLDRENEKIKWIVLDKDEKENKALVISKYGLESKRFDSEEKETSTWDNSEIRTWLNSDFLDKAFSNDEKKYILNTNVLAEDNMEKGTYDGKDTVDRIFLLSLSEAKSYFKDYKLNCLPAFEVQKVNEDERVSPYASWWLRTPGDKSGKVCYASFYDNKNHFDSYGQEAKYNLLVRPCMWIKYVDKELVKVDDGKSRLIIGDKNSKVAFGKYYINEEQYINDDLDNIIWKVLYKDEENKKALLVTEYAIDNIPYDDKYDMMTWENSYIREWLNNDFYNFAFTPVEKEKIVKTKLSNYNYYTTSDGGNDTYDKVFLLSAEEVDEFFDGDKRCIVSPFAEKDAYYKKGTSEDGKNVYNYGNYALRTPCDNGYAIKTIHSDGYMIDGFEDQSKGTSIRPAIWVNYNDEKEISNYHGLTFESLFERLFVKNEVDIDKHLDGTIMNLTSRFKKNFININEENDNYKFYEIFKNKKFSIIDRDYENQLLYVDTWEYVDDENKISYDDNNENIIVEIPKPKKIIAQYVLRYILDSDNYLDDLRILKVNNFFDEGGKRKETSISFDKYNYLRMIKSLFLGKKYLINRHSHIQDFIDNEFDNYSLTNSYRTKNDINEPLYDKNEIADILMKKMNEADPHYLEGVSKEEFINQYLSDRDPYLSNIDFRISYLDYNNYEEDFDNKNIILKLSLNNYYLVSNLILYYNIEFETYDNSLDDVKVKLVKVVENNHNIKDSIDFVSSDIKNVNTFSNSYENGIPILKNDKIIEMGRYKQIRKMNEEKIKDLKDGKLTSFELVYDEIEDDIKWIVLDYDEKEGKVLLFSEKILDGSIYTEYKFDYKWGSSKLRDWLNNEFYNSAFSTEEKNNILTSHLETIYASTIVNKEEPEETDDKIFVLSDEDIKKYYPDWKSRIGKLTSYAAKSVPYNDGEKNTGNYWIRGKYQFVSGSNGNTWSKLDGNDFSGVRPAMWVKVDKDRDIIKYKNYIIYERYESLIKEMFEKNVNDYEDFPVTEKFKSENDGGLFKKYDLKDDANYTYSIYVDKEKQAIKIYEYFDKYDDGYYLGTYITREIDLMYSLSDNKYIDEIISY